MTVLLRLYPEMCAHMRTVPIDCVCGNNQFKWAEDDLGFGKIICSECDHHGPGIYGADYVACVNAWNDEMADYGEKLAQG